MISNLAERMVIILSRNQPGGRQKATTRATRSGGRRFGEEVRHENSGRSRAEINFGRKDRHPSWLPEGSIFHHTGLPKPANAAQPASTRVRSCCVQPTNGANRNQAGKKRKVYFELGVPLSKNQTPCACFGLPTLHRH